MFIDRANHAVVLSKSYYGNSHLQRKTPITIAEHSGHKLRYYANNFLGVLTK